VLLGFAGGEREELLRAKDAAGLRILPVVLTLRGGGVVPNRKAPRGMEATESMLFSRVPRCNSVVISFCLFLPVA